MESTLATATSSAPAQAGSRQSAATGAVCAFPPPQLLRLGADPRLLLVADHASSHIPARYQNLGLPPQALDSHWGVDLGTEALCCELSERLDAPAVLCPVSRLVIDCNRDPDTDPDSIRPQLEAGVPVPGNSTLDDGERTLRRQCLDAYHDAIAHCLEQLDQRLGRPAALLSAHSFTAHMGAVARRVDIGILWRDDRRMATTLMAALERGEHRCEAVELRENEPYSAYEMSYTLSRHGLGLGRLGCALEIRQDHLEPPDRAHWLRYLAAAVQQCREQLTD